MGEIKIGNRGKRDIMLQNNPSQFKVLEAKIFSELSQGISNASYYDQAVRNIACMSEVISRAGVNLENLEDIGFYVLVPLKQIREKTSFKEYMSKKSMKNKVLKRINSYEKEDREIKMRWFNNWFLPVLEKVKVKCLRWEEVIDFIKYNQIQSGKDLEKFYNKCLKYNS